MIAQSLFHGTARLQEEEGRRLSTTNLALQEYAVTVDALGAKLDSMTQVALRAKTDEDAFRALLDKFHSFIRLVTRDVLPLYYDTSDEVEQVMRIELWNAVQTFNVSFGLPFKVFAVHCLRRRLKSWMRTHFYTGKSVFNWSNVRMDDSSRPLTAAESSLVSDPDDYLCREELYATLRRFIQSALTQLERNVFILWYAEDSYDEISSKLGLDKKAIDNALARAKKKLRSSQLLLDLQ